MTPKSKRSARPFRIYTVIGSEWFTLLAARRRVSGSVTILGDVVNLDEKEKVLDRWSEVRLTGVPLLVAKE